MGAMKEMAIREMNERVVVPAQFVIGERLELFGFSPELDGFSGVFVGLRETDSWLILDKCVYKDGTQQSYKRAFPITNLRHAAPLSNVVKTSEGGTSKPQPEVGQIWKCRDGYERSLGTSKDGAYLTGKTNWVESYRDWKRIDGITEGDLIALVAWVEGYGHSIPPIEHKAVAESPKSEPQDTWTGRDSDGLTPTDRRLRDERIARQEAVAPSCETSGDLHAAYARKHAKDRIQEYREEVAAAEIAIKRLEHSLRLRSS